MQRLIEKLKTIKSSAIFTHKSADGDAIGSALALQLILSKLGIDAVAVLEEVPEKPFDFLRGKYVTTLEKKVDLVICVDCGDLKRIANLGDLQVDVIIDHHITNKGFADINIIEPDAAATGMLIYDLSVKLGIELDTDIATNIYTAILTDTGGFKFVNTTTEVFEAVSHLVKFGVDIVWINKYIFDTMSRAKLALMVDVMQAIEFYFEDKVAIILLPFDKIERYNAKKNDIEGLSGFARSIEGVEVGVLIKENKDGLIRVSLRSNKQFDVSKIAVMFGGGGHVRASGYTVDGDLNSAKSRLIEAFELFK